MRLLEGLHEFLVLPFGNHPGPRKRPELTVHADQRRLCSVRFGAIWIHAVDGWSWPYSTKSAFAPITMPSCAPGWMESRR